MIMHVAGNVIYHHTCYQVYVNSRELDRMVYEAEEKRTVYGLA